MEPIANIEEAQAKVLTDINAFLASARVHAAEDVSDVASGLLKLRNIRSSVYENLNQIQHEYLILRGLWWLSENGHAPVGINWYWNPRQTGDSTEPDLRGVLDGEIVVSAEATTSEKPQGVIDSRMKNTLEKLEKMPGERYYFIRTRGMEQRAKTKVRTNGWRIAVVAIEG